MHVLVNFPATFPFGDWGLQMLPPRLLFVCPVQEIPGAAVYKSISPLVGTDYHSFPLYVLRVWKRR